MPVISAGSNATVSATTNDTLTIQNPGGWAQLECPVGTKIWEGCVASQSFSLAAGGAFKLTSVQGPIYYEVGLGTIATTSPPCRPNTVYQIGDSLQNQGWATTGSPVTFTALNAEGASEWAYALLDGALVPIANASVGGKTAAQVLTEQLPTALASAAQYIDIQSLGHNDLYSEGVTGVVSAARVISILEQILNAGKVPIYSTVWARDYDSVILRQHLHHNDLIRNWYARTGGGIFWDGFAVSVDPTSATCVGRTNWYRDSGPAIHVNNRGAYFLGKAKANAISKFVNNGGLWTPGAHDQANDIVGRTNLLANPIMSGSVALVATGTAGVAPTGWTVDWATRTGTATATGAIVDITDSVTGLPLAKAIEVTVSGTAAANDVLRITQASGFNTLLSGGDVTSAGCRMQVATPANVNNLAMRVQTNTSESTWWGNAAYTAQDFTEGFTVGARARDMSVLGSGASSQARFDVRMRFSGAGTGTVLRIWSPYVRKGA